MRHDIKLIWVEGHADIAGNDEADRLAKMGVDKITIPMGRYAPQLEPDFYESHLWWIAEDPEEEEHLGYIEITKEEDHLEAYTFEYNCICAHCENRYEVVLHESYHYPLWYWEKLPV